MNKMLTSIDHQLSDLDWELYELKRMEAVYGVVADDPRLESIHGNIETALATARNLMRDCINKSRELIK